MHENKLVMKTLKPKARVEDILLIFRGYKKEQNWLHLKNWFYWACYQEFSRALSGGKTEQSIRSSHLKYLWLHNVPLFSLVTHFAVKFGLHLPCEDQHKLQSYYSKSNIQYIKVCKVCSDLCFWRFFLCLMKLTYLHLMET